MSSDPHDTPRASPPHGPAPLALTLPSLAESVSRARHAAGDYAEHAGVDRDSVAIAVSEAVGNAVLHGYRDGREGPVELCAKPNGEGLLVTVSDAGAGMSPHPTSSGLGIGLSLIGRVTDHLEIDSEPGSGTRLSMRFRFATAS